MALVDLFFVQRWCFMANFTFRIKTELKIVKLGITLAKIRDHRLQKQKRRKKRELAYSTLKTNKPTEVIKGIALQKKKADLTPFLDGFQL